MKRGRRFMPVEVAFLVVALAAIAITYKTYVGYGEYHWYTKLGCFLFVAFGWFAPLIGFAVHRTSLEDSFVYITKILYFWFGFVFFLFAITVIRDMIWALIDFIRRVPVSDLKNTALLNKVNVGTIVFCLLFCLYGLYEAEKMPTIKTYDISSPKIKEATKVVMLSDLHIDADTSPKTVKKLVDEVNSLKPDAVVLVGDIIDNAPGKLFAQMMELKQLSPRDHVYVVLGNHEFYSGAMQWAVGFAQLGFEFLNNYGAKLGNTGIYIAGIPDIRAAECAKMKVNINHASYKPEKDDYVILLSHTPQIAAGVNKDNVDLQLSGHTHGGQIYPFHYFAERANGGVLAGFYNKNGVEMYVSRGTRYWGPPIRIFAPSEITVFNFTPSKEEKADATATPAVLSAEAQDNKTLEAKEDKKDE